MVAAWRIVSSCGLIALLALVTISSRPTAAGATPAADATTVLVVVDSPAAGSSVDGRGVLRGWAADPGAASGSGVDRVEVYLDGERAGGTLLGSAAYGSPRPDVARNLGAGRFVPSGYALPLALPPGPHTLNVYAHASEQPGDTGWSAPTTLALLVGTSGPLPNAAAGAPALPPAHCLGIPAPFGVYGLETPQSYGAIYPTDVPFVFGNPAFWATYGAPAAPAYVDFTNGTVLPNAYFYQPRPARGIPIAC